MCGYSSPQTQHTSVRKDSCFMHSGTSHGSVTPLPWWVYGITFLAFIAVILTAVMTLIK